MLPIFGVISASCLVVQELHDDLMSLYNVNTL